MRALGRRKTWALLAAGACVAASLAEETASKPAGPESAASASPPGDSNPRVVLEIQHARKDRGRIVIELDPVKAPQTVKNFLSYVDDGFYSGTIFHRVIPNYIAQGGGYINPNREKTNGLRGAIPNEADNGLKNLRGTIAMARKWKQPDTATCEFFINLKDNPGLDARHPDGDGFGYCVFGKVVEGMEIVDRIVNIATRFNPKLPRENSVPVVPPIIIRAYRFGSTPPPLPGQPTTQAGDEEEPSPDRPHGDLPAHAPPQAAPAAHPAPAASTRPSAGPNSGAPPH